MGVTGLWKLIEPCGTPVPVETLEGKILAIDISIWLHQVVKGFQDSKGSALANAHLLGLFHRLCKLLYYRVKPVFVFDGCTPQLKRDTIARRQQQRSKLNTEADRIQAILLQSLAKEKVVQQALGANAADILKSPAKRGAKSARAAEKEPDEMFKLPELPAGTFPAKSADDTNQTDSSFCSGTDDYTTTADEDSSFDESNQRHAYNTNLQAIDVKSRHFQDLPADVRHEILVDIKETRKQSSWGRLHELPSRSDDFSTFQMKRLLKRRAVQESLEVAEQEMGGRTLSYAELQNFFTEEGIVEPSVMEKGSKQISSDEHTRYLLVRDLKKKLTKIEETQDEDASAVKDLKTEAVEKPEEANVKDVKEENPAADCKAPKELGEEYDKDLAMAIALSLENPNDTSAAVYREEDYEYEAGGSLRLNREQRKQLQNAAVGPARAYMIEYGGMNDDEVGGIMEKTQLHEDVYDGAEEDEMLKRAIAESLKSQELAKVPDEELITLRVSDSETDSDLEPVVDDANEITVIEDSEELKLRISDASETDSDLEEVPSVKEEKALEKKPKALEIVLDIKEDLKVEEDLFADIFEEKTAVIELSGEDEKEQETTIRVKENDEKVEGIQPKLVGKPLVKEAAAMASILNELQQQVQDIKHISLEDVKLDVKTEVIEIYDSDSEMRKSPSVSVNKSPKLKTPSKNKTISEFFQTDYVIKRTPEKSLTEQEHVAKVTSPFFVKRTPTSGKKSGEKHEDSPKQSKKRSKASKSLFEDVIEVAEGEPVPKKPSPPPTTEDLITEAADVLRSQRTAEELSTMATELARERTELEAERNRQDRMGMSISQRMNVDCQELLRLFGIPYIVAPMEAEAQCAFLDAVELTNGTITDDSDIWLFGGRTVYKNFFAQNKHVLEFRSNEIEKSFNCDRPKLIQLACLVGSDYTTGIHGIGAVTALEILASFNAQNLTGQTDNVSAALMGLQKFRDWWQFNKSAGSSAPGSSARMALRKKLKNIELHEGFPSTAVIEAYLSPKVDDSRDAFTWGYPDIESIREFARKSFGWTSAKTDNILMPVIKKLNEKRTQATIRNYFTTKSAIAVRDLKVSKRVQKAIDKMSGQVDEETPEKAATKKRRAKRKQILTLINDEDPLEVAASGTAETPTTSTSSAGLLPEKRTRRGVRIPDTKEVIPQREKDLAQMRENKAKAAEVLKKAAAAKKATRNAKQKKKD